MFSVNLSWFSGASFVFLSTPADLVLACGDMQIFPVFYQNAY